MIVELENPGDFNALKTPFIDCFTALDPDNAAAAESSFEQGLSQMSSEDGMVETEKLRIVFSPQNATEAGHIQIIVPFN